MAGTESRGPAESLRALQGKRILLGPSDAGSLATRMANALCDQGARCFVLNLSPHPYLAGEDELHGARSVATKSISRMRDLARKGLLGRLLNRGFLAMLRVATVVWALFRVDAVILITNRSFFRSGFDVRLFRLVGIRIVRLFVGSDSRPRYLDGCHDALLDERTRSQYALWLEAAVRRQFSKVERASRWADVVIENPLCGHFQRRPFVNWFCVGFPHDERAFGGVSDRDPDARFVVMHCPSTLATKGTERIEAAIETLQAEGHSLEYVRITGMPRAEVLRALPRCDLLVDQLYSDSPMAAVASEAAAFCKTVLVGGYGWAELERVLPAGEVPPTIRIRPEDFEKELRALITGPRHEDSARRAYAFVNGHWSSDAVAERLAILLDPGGSIPDAWMCDPTAIRYWEGYGAPREHRQRVLDCFVRERGSAALCAAPGFRLPKTTVSQGPAL